MIDVAELCLDFAFLLPRSFLSPSLPRSYFLKSVGPRRIKVLDK